MRLQTLMFTLQEAKNITPKSTKLRNYSP